MTDKQPTQKELKEFWIKCGFEEVQYYDHNNKIIEGAIHYTHTKNVGGGCSTLPILTLDNLFEYAIKSINKVIEGRRCIRNVSFKLMVGGTKCTLETAIVAFEGNQERGAGVLLSQSSGDKLTFISTEKQKPELALYYAIKEVLDAK